MDEDEFEVFPPPLTRSPVRAQAARRSTSGEHARGDTHTQARTHTAAQDADDGGGYDAVAGGDRSPASLTTPRNVSTRNWQFERIARYAEYVSFYGSSRIVAEVAVAFRYASVHHIAVGPEFRPIDMLPLCEMLKYDNVITHLDLHRAGGIGNAGAYALSDVLSLNRTLRDVDVSHQDVGEHGAMALAKAAMDNTALTRVCLRGNRIGGSGAAAWARVLRSRNCRITYLDLSNNYLRVAGVRAITRALLHRAHVLEASLREADAHSHGSADDHAGDGARHADRGSTGSCAARRAAKASVSLAGSGWGWLCGDVTELVVASDSTVRTNFRSMPRAFAHTTPRHASAPLVSPASEPARRTSQSHAKGGPHDADGASFDSLANDIEVRVSGNFVQDEVVSSVVHGLGTLLAVIGAFPLLSKVRADGDPAYFVSCLAYVTATIAFFASSTLNHSLFLTDASAVFRLVDHSAVYMVIASTYSPFLTVNIRHAQPLAHILLATVWALGLIGVLVSTLWPASVFQRRLRIMLYMLMGWMGVVPGVLLYACVAPTGWALLAGGGLVFSAGVGMYLRSRANTSHEMQWVWYLFVLLASALHWLAVYYYTAWPSQECIDAALEQSLTSPAQLVALRAAGHLPEHAVRVSGMANATQPALARLHASDNAMLALPASPITEQMLSAAATLADLAASTAADSRRALRDNAVALLRNMIETLEGQ